MPRRSVTVTVQVRGATARSSSQFRCCFASLASQGLAALRAHHRKEEVIGQKAAKRELMAPKGDKRFIRRASRRNHQGE